MSPLDHIVPVPLETAMKQKESGRHLAVILFTDIVGYTTLMQRNEPQALAAVRRHRQTMERLIPE